MKWDCMLTLENKLRILESEQALRTVLSTSIDSEQYYNDFVSSLGNDELKQEIEECKQEILKGGSRRNSKP